MLHAVAWHLRQAAARYGDDLPLRVRATAPTVVAPPAAPAPSAAAAPSAAKPSAATSSTVAPTPEPRPAPAEAAAPPEPAAPPANAPAPSKTLEELQARVADCTRCKLHAGRTHLVFGEGNPDADVLFVGEAPGAREDEQGRPFVGPAGQLLTKIIENAMGMARDDVYIANVNKCRPPNNRNPEPDEVAACLPILRRQVDLIRPKVIVAMGRVAAANLLSTTDSVTRLRGRELQAAGVPVVVTWHPAYLLRTPAAKGETWEDIKRVNRLLGRPEVPGRG